LRLCAVRVECLYCYFFPPWLKFSWMINSWSEGSFGGHNLLEFHCRATWVCAFYSQQWFPPCPSIYELKLGERNGTFL
jgi:hypothetical protein